MCSVEWCNEQKLEAKGRCVKHYRQYRLYGENWKGGRGEPNEVIRKGGRTFLVLRSFGPKVKALTEVDKEDVPLASEYKWYLGKTGYVMSKRNIRTEKKGSFRLHRLVKRVEDNAVLVDHVSGDKLNNKKTNLRECTVSENRHNARAGTGVGTVPSTRGVFFDRAKNLYVARIAVAKKEVDIRKYFKTLPEAIEYRKYLADKYHGEFAYENRPNETSPSV